MRRFLGIAALTTALWSGYWLAGKTAVERGFAAFLAQAPGNGVQVTEAGHSVAGFPNRFSLTVTEPRVVDARSKVAWQSPFVQMASFSYKPWHVIADFAPEQRLTTPLQDITLLSDPLQASLVVFPGPALALEQVTLAGKDLAARSSLGWAVAAQDLRFALSADPTTKNAYQVAFDAANVAPDAALVALLPDLPAVIGATKMDAMVSLTAPLDRFASETRPRPSALSLRELSVTWGDLSVFASGDVAVIAGLPEGRIDIRVTGWRHLVTFATTTGLIKPEVAPTALGMIEAYASGSGDPNVLAMPLVFAKGQMRLGPLPLGPAPRFD